MSDYQSTATSTIYVNGKPAEDELRKLKERASDLRDAIAAAGKAGNKADLSKFRSELKSTNREIKNVENSIHTAENVMKRLNKATPKELNMALKQLKKELNDMERGSDAWNKQVAKIKLVKKELDSVNAEMREHKSVLSRVKDGINDWGMSIASAAAALTGLTMTIRQAVQAYADMDQEMANVQKFTGMEADEVKALNEEFKKIDTRTPREELNKLAQEAGKLGKTSQEDVLGFVRAADKINVALDELGEGATLTLSKITGIFGDEERLGTEKSLLAVGSVINELSQNCRASAPYLAEFAQRMSGVGSQSGMTVQQIMAFGAVLDSNGQKVESSATALGQVITKLYKEPAKYAKAAGLDVKEFTDLLKNDANAAVIQLLETLNNAGNLDALAPMFKEMGENGARSISTLATLAKHIEEVKEQQQNANIAFAEATSIDREFDVQNNTVAAGIEKAKNSFHEMAAALGEKLAPAMSYVVTSSAALLKSLSWLIDFAIKYKTTLITLAGSIAYLTIAMKAELVQTRLAIVTKTINNALDKASIALTAARRAATLLVAAAVNLFRGNMVRATAATRAFNIAMSSTGWGALVSIIGVAVAAIAGYIDKTRMAKQETESLANSNYKFSESVADVTANIAIEVSEVSRLRSAIDAENQGSATRNALIKQFNDHYGSYMKKLLSEKSTVYDVADAYAAVVANLRAKLYLEGKNADIKRIVAPRIGWEATRLSEYDTWARGIGSPYGGSWLKAWADSNYKNFQDANAMYRGLETYVQNHTKHSDPMAWSMFVGGTGSKGFPYNHNFAKAYIDQYYSTRWHMAQVERKWAPYQAEIDGWIAESYSIQNSRAGLAGRGGGGHGGGHGSHGGGGGGTSRPAPTDIFKEEEKWRKEEEAKLKIQYNNFQIDLETYTRGMLNIELEFYKKQLANKKATEEQKLDITARYEEAERKLQEYNNQIDIDLEERSYKMRVAQKKQEFINGEIDQEKYNEDIEKLEEEHLINLATIYKRQAALPAQIWADARNAASNAFSTDFHGNVDLSNLAEIDSHKLTAAGWSGYAEEEGQEYVRLHTKEYTVTGADKKKHSVVVTPILPDGTVLSEKDLKAYVDKTLAGASDFLSADSKGIVVSVDAKKEDVEALSELIDVFYSVQPGNDPDLWGKYLDAEDKYRTHLIDKMLEKQEKEKKAAEERLAKLEELKDEYFGLNEVDKQTLYDNTLAMLDEIYKSELAKLGDNEKAKLELERKYAEAKKKLHDKIFEEEEKKNTERNKNWEEWTQTLLDKMFGKGTWEKYGGFITSAMASLSSAYQNITKLVEAEEQIKLNAIKKKYDAEIKAAEGNQYRINQLQKKQAAEEKRIKDSANKRAMVMEMAQAVSGTALAAINAYASASKQLWLLGPIAAGMALAAGAIQIAAIKKSHDAQAQGYSEGGFTKPGAKDEPAGIVHAGEWVASQKLLASPVARPVIEALDYAQRTNTIGRLGTSSARRSSQQAAAAAGAPVVVTESQELRSVIKQLTDRLNEPFVTINTVAGPHGIDQAQKDYNKLMNNTLPKNKRK